jgi:hypothetical protein
MFIGATPMIMILTWMFFWQVSVSELVMGYW